MTRTEIIDLSNSYKNGEERSKIKQHFQIDEDNIIARIQHASNNISQQKSTIVFSAPSETGTSQFRIFEPMLSMYRFTDEFNYIYTEKLQPWHYNLADLIVLHRAGDLHDICHSVLNVFPSHKVKPYLLGNNDDQETILSKKHPMYDMWQVSGRPAQALRSIRDCNGVEVTTYKLKQFSSQHNRNVIITRNYFNWRLPQWNLTKKKPLQDFVPVAEPEKFEFPEQWNDKIVVGWAGLTSHFEDIAKMAPMLRRIYQKYPNTVFILAGMALKDSGYKITKDKDGKVKMEEDNNIEEKMKYRNRVESLFGDFAPDRIKIYDALPLEQYAWFNSLFDIGLAYIEHNTFNAAKSEIKTVELCKYKAIPVFSNYGGYADFIKELKDTGKFTDQEISKMACRTEFSINEWVDKISYWVENFDTDERRNLADRLSNFVTGFYDIDERAPEKVAMYKNMIEQNIEKENVRITSLGYVTEYDYV